MSHVQQYTTVDDFCTRWTASSHMASLISSDMTITFIEYATSAGHHKNMYTHRNEKKRHKTLAIATAYWLVSAASCYKGSKSSRTLSLVLLQESEDQSIWRPSYVIFTGCRFDGGSRSRQQFWSISVCTTWLHSTFRHTVNSCQPASSIRSLRPTDCSTHQSKLWQPQFRRPRTSCP